MSRAILAGMAKGICSVCAAPPDVVQAVNEAIRKREKFRELAARTAFSRAALHRHSKKCIPRNILAEHKARKFDNLRQIVWTKWFDGTLTRMPVPHDFRGELRSEPGPGDVVLVVEFEPPVAKPAPAPDPPPALPPVPEQGPDTPVN